MATFSEEILARYKQKESEVDAFGRKITVARLRPFDAMRVRRLIESDDNSVISEILVAASVRSISDGEDGEAVFAPPKDEGGIQTMMNLLDQEGYAAAVKAYARLYGIGQENADADGVDGGAGTETDLDKAKN